MKVKGTAAACALAAVAALGVSACSVVGGWGNSKPEPAYIARLKHDGYTNIKPGVSTNPEFGCADFAVGEDSNGDGYGELVVQCPTSDDAYLAALNLAGRQDGTLVIVTGPLSSL